MVDIPPKLYRTLLSAPRTTTTRFGFPDGSRPIAAVRIRDLYGSMFCEIFSTGKGPGCGSRYRAIRPGNQLFLNSVMVRSVLSRVAGIALHKAGLQLTEMRQP